MLCPCLNGYNLMVQTPQMGKNWSPMWYGFVVLKYLAKVQWSRDIRYKNEFLLKRPF